MRGFPFLHPAIEARASRATGKARSSGLLLTDLTRFSVSRNIGAPRQGRKLWTEQDQPPRHPLARVINHQDGWKGAVVARERRGRNAPKPVTL